MSDSDDSYEYENYAIEWYSEFDEGPPLIKKKSRILLTVVQNDVEGLAALLDSPRWYRVRDKYGYNILQIAILCDNKEVFDYLMSLEDFPIDEPTRGQTALEISLTGFVSNDIWMRSHYAYELLQRDVNINIVCYEQNTLLHCALERGFVQVARLLLEKGADVNAQNEEGVAALDQCCFYCEEKKLAEAVSMMLYYGADVPNSDAFSTIMRSSGENILVAQEALFYYTFDQYACVNVDIAVLLQMACDKNPLFEQVLENASTVISNNLSSDYVYQLLSMEPQYLQILMEKCGSAIEDLLLWYLDMCQHLCVDQCQKCQMAHATVKLESSMLTQLDMLVNSKFNSIVVDLICKMNCTSILVNLIDKQHSLSMISEVLCYVLSHGASLKSDDLCLIYKHFNHCELFRTLLHMDIEMRGDRVQTIIPALHYDMNLHIDSYLQDPRTFSVESGIEELLSFSARPRLRELCYKLNKDHLREKVKRLPQIPLLVELSRDVFRRYFIEKFNITTSRRFYTLLKSLPISEVHRKIVAFQYKLYN